MPLSKKQLDNVCLLNGGSSQCRYLEIEDYTKCNCLRQTGLKSKIDEKVQISLDKMKKNGQDPGLHGVPVGTGGGCAGYPLLRTLKFGYDVKTKK